MLIWSGGHSARELASSIAGFDSQAITESKALIDAEALPDNEQLLAPHQAFSGSAGRLGSGRAQC